MSRSNRVLVLGAGGLLGGHVALALRERKSWSVVEHANLRFGSEEELKKYVLFQAPTTVINCIGYKGEKAEDHFLINASFPHAIAHACEILSAFFIQISTNAVFPPDEERHWRPEDPLDPRTPYEVSKAKGEDPRAYVLRTSFIGVSPKGEGLLDRLRQGKPYLNRKWNGVTAATLARHIVSLIGGHDGGLFPALEHVHSPRDTSFLEIATFLRSPSTCEGERHDARLLGGGPPMTDILDQLAGCLQI